MSNCSECGKVRTELDILMYASKCESCVRKAVSRDLDALEDAGKAPWNGRRPMRRIREEFEVE